jgi:hypothetical protein
MPQKIGDDPNQPKYIKDLCAKNCGLKVETKDFKSGTQSKYWREHFATERHRLQFKDNENKIFEQHSKSITISSVPPVISVPFITSVPPVKTVPIIPVFPVQEFDEIDTMDYWDITKPTKDNEYTFEEIANEEAPTGSKDIPKS